MGWQVTSHHTKEGDRMLEQTAKHMNLLRLFLGITQRDTADSPMSDDEDSSYMTYPLRPQER